MEALTINQLPKNISARLKVVDEHWIWTGAISSFRRSDKKGRVRFNDKMEYPHRVVFHLATGFDLNSSSQVNHKRECIYSLCCNPICLYAGTQKENVQDSIALGHNKELAKTRCPNCGSRYSTSNTTGHRYCQRCKNARRDLWRSKQKK